MDLSPYLSSLREDLNTTASAGDEDTKRAAAVLSAALEPAARLAIMNALSDLAAEVTSQLDGPVVDVRLDGRDVRVVVSGSDNTGHDTDDAASRPSEPTPPPPSGGDISRMTLRLFEELKDKAEQAASDQGVSLNTWVQQAVQGALHGAQKGGPWGRGPKGPGPRPRRRRGWDDESGDELHGWVRP